jgi:uncharacterized NAD(P)/FAD-binding protein YdhS
MPKTSGSPFSVAIVGAGFSGTYMADSLAQAVAAAAPRGVTLQRVRDRVVAIARTRAPFELSLAAGGAMVARRIVLATGHLPPALPATGSTLCWGDAGLVGDPWLPAARAPLDPWQDILLLGTGLTAVDVLTQWRDAGHRGRINMLSRRGQLPQPHRVLEARPPVGLQPVHALGDELRLAQVLRAVHAWIARARDDGGDWRDVMASVRPWTPYLWQRLSPRDRRQFLRHLQPFWDTHRHRLAPAIHAQHLAEMASGDVQVRAGRMTEIRRDAKGLLEVKWRARGSERIETLHVGRVVNCTGPTSNLARARDRLLGGLRDAGVLCSDGLGQGLLVDAHLRPIDASGVSVEGLHYVGPMLKAQRWEAVAVPELRVHARDVARQVVASLSESFEYAD